MEILVQFMLIVLGFVMLVVGADWFVEGAAGIARKFGIPQLVIGLTIVAMGTSAPEAAVSITAALKGDAGICVGNVVGSNILNILIILGLTAVITPLAIQASTLHYEIPFTFLVTVLMTFLGLSGDVIGRGEGIVLWLFMLLYLGYLLWMSRHGVSEPEERSGEKSIPWLLLSGVVGIVLVIWGSDVTVDAATALARIFGMSERFIGLTIVALGTSLPELVTSVTAARKHNADIAIGNIVGSNIFNILFVLGTTALITPVAYEAGFFIDSMFAAAAVLLLFAGVLPKRKLTRPVGVVMLVFYVAYFAYLIH